MAQFSLEVTSDHAVPIPAGATVTNSSGDTLYYADYPGLTSGTNVGSIAAGSSITFATEFWVRSASLSTVTVVTVGSAFQTPLVGGAGDNINYSSGVSASGTLVQLTGGTAGAPDAGLNPLLKGSRTLSLASAAVGGDGVDQAAVGGGQVTGTASNQVQTVGWYGIANNAGSAKGASLSPDACGIYGIGRINGSGVGFGIGAYFRGSSASSTGFITTIQADTFNNRGSDDSPNSTGTSNSVLGWFIANGPNRSASCFQFGNPLAQQFHTGIHVNAQAPATGSRVDASCATTNLSTTVVDAAVVATDVGRAVSGTGIPANTVITSVSAGVSFVMNNAATATNNPISLTLAQTGPFSQNTFLDEGTSVNSIVVGGTHNIAIAVKSGAGPIVAGGSTRLLTTTVFEAQFPNATADPGAVFGNTTGNFFSVQLRNGNGNGRWFVSGGAGNGLTGTIAGDTGYIQTTASTFYHIGGSTSVIKVGNANTLGFFNVTAVAKQTAAGNVSVTAAGATNTVFYNTTFTGGNGSTAYTVGDLVAALKAYGLLTV